MPGINGQPVQFLAIPRNENGEDFRKTGIRVPTGLQPSGGGTKANVWTMIADIYWGEGHGFGTLFRSHDLDGNNDGDLFWRASDGTYGKGCCSLYDGVDPAHSLPRNAWGRVVLVADLTSSPRKFAKYYNRFKHRQDLSGDGDGIDSRFALPSEIFMFNDGDDNEQSTAYVNAIQIRPVALTDEEVAALGGPSAAGIPQPQTVSPSIKGHWEFNGDLKAAIGSDVAYIDNALSSHYSFGTTGQGAFADVPAIDGQSAQFLAIPRNENGEDFRKTGIRVSTGLQPSGGGTKANVWTMIADIYWGEGHGFGTLFRSHDLDGNNDGDLFWRASDGGYGKGCCSLYDGVDPAHNIPRNTWGRLVLVSDLTASPRKFAKYYNGFKHREDVGGDGNAIDSRFALPAEIFMFNDGDDNEQSTAYISSLQFRDVALTDEEAAALGGPSAGGIPVTGAANDCGQPPPPPAQPRLAVSLSGGNLVISWSGTGFVLESSDALVPAAWTAVAGVTGNSATVPLTGSTKFYRLR
ncbi:MAG: hypothetical protein L0Z50_10215 [Verrucomicrobiales bacterium]|nr:hypothetical protein [Verrucomicrobiales bacterium]